MPSSRVKVVPPYRGRGMVGLASLLGALAGLAVLELHRLISPMGAGSIAMLFVRLLAPIVGLGALFALALACITDRYYRFVILGAVFWMAMAAAMESSHLSALVSWSELLSRLGVELAVAGVIGAIISWFVLGCVGRFCFTIAEQDGELCWRCAYRTGSPQITVCPECGTDIDTSRFKSHWLHRSVAFGRVTGWIGTLGLSAVAAVMVMAQAHAIAESSRFTRAMKRFGTIEQTFMVLPGSTFMRPDQTPCLAATIPLQFPMLLQVAFDPRNQKPPMQLQVNNDPSAVNPGTMPFSIPRVLCDLDARQAELVMQNGVPPALTDAMVSAAATVQWNSGPIATPIPPDIRIDPAPYFPPR